MPKRIEVPPIDDGWDPVKEEFFTLPGTSFTIEHSLVSISKWESTWQKPFLKTKDKTPEEMLDYIRCMTLTQNVKPEVYERLSPDIVREIWDYVESPQSAATIVDVGAQPKEGQAPSRELVTSEVIYSWMVEHGIPFECQKWHLNRLMNVIKILNKRARNAAGNKPTMSKRELLQRNRALNAQRRAKLNSKG